MTEPTARIVEPSGMRSSMAVNPEPVVIPLSEILEEEAIKVESKYGLNDDLGMNWKMRSAYFSISCRKDRQS